MSGAFAVALNTLFMDPNLSVPGWLTLPGGARHPVRVLHRSGTDRVAGGIGGAGVQAEADSAEVLAAQVPAQPPRFSVLEFGGRTFRTANPAKPARNGLTWQMVLSGG